jgi:hypothetical protein
MMLLGMLLAAASVELSGLVYACGDDQVRELTIGSTAITESWRWTAKAAADLPPDYRNALLGHIDECKPVENGRAILVTASTGGAVLIDRATGRVRFRARVPMAHSAALLPGGLVAVALSIDPAGDRLDLYDVRYSEQVIQTLPLPSGHGAVWDARRQRLFALSHDLVQAFRLDRGAAGPRLVESARWSLPGRHDGHDLSPAPDGGYYLTTDDGVWRFDPDRGSFEPYAPLNPSRRVKAVSAVADRIAWVQAEASWWAHGFTVMRPDGSDRRHVPVPDLHLYKVRWVR